MVDITDIRQLDSDAIERSVEAGLQAYAAFRESDPARCRRDAITPPEGYELLDCWTGVDAVFGDERTVEVYGLVFRQLATPHRYLFAFRGTASLLDALDDLGVESASFQPESNTSRVPAGVSVEAGFQDVYRTSDGPARSMQQQLFALIDQYRESEKPLRELAVTGHSLGAALSQLFTLDVALSRPDIALSNINFASPRVGNKAFADFYDRQLSSNSLRVQNRYDAVPCSPPEALGYRHTARAYIIAFYRHEAFGKLNLLDCHSCLNYQAVVQCAARSPEGVCRREALEVPGNGYSVTSTMPDVSRLCEWR